MAPDPDRKPELSVDCPGCGAPTPYNPQNPWRPFCSEQCRRHDLGAWASERYRVAATTPDGESDGSDTPAH